MTEAMKDAMAAEQVARTQEHTALFLVALEASLVAVTYKGDAHVAELEKRLAEWKEKQWAMVRAMEAVNKLLRSENADLLGSEASNG